MGQLDSWTAGQWNYSLSAFELGKQYCTSCSSCKCSISKVKSSRINMQSVHRCVCKLAYVCVYVFVCVCLSVSTYFSVVYAYIFEAIAVSINHLKFVPNKYSKATNSAFRLQKSKIPRENQNLPTGRRKRRWRRSWKSSWKIQMKINIGTSWVDIKVQLELHWFFKGTFEIVSRKNIFWQFNYLNCSQ